MSMFVKKEIEESKRICIRLKEAREAAGISLDSLSKKKRNNTQYLRALEECRFDDLPVSPLYQKNFIKTYLTALGIHPDPFIHQYLREEIPSADQTRHTHPAPPVRSMYFHNLPQLIRSTVTAMIVLSLIGYLGLQVKHIVEPPTLTVHSPTDGMITENRSLVIQGETEKEVSVFINGKEIVNKNNGQFEEQLDLGVGVNTIIISAKKKYGKTKTETRHVTVRTPSQFSFRNP